jgi:hypothetical protein
MVNQPAATFVAGKLLELADHDEAGVVMLRVMEGLHEELIAQGWTERDAHGTVLRFGHEVTAVLAALRDRRSATVH